VRMQAGLGLWLELLFYFTAFELADRLNAVADTFFTLQSLHDFSGFGPSSGLVFAAVVAMRVCLPLLILVWLMNRVGASLGFPGRFYAHLSKEAGLPHHAVSLVAFQRPIIVAFSCAAVALGRLLIRLVHHQKAGSRGTIFLALICFGLFAIPFVLMTLRHTIPRWLAGRAATFTAIGVSICSLGPIILLSAFSKPAGILAQESQTSMSAVLRLGLLTVPLIVALVAVGPIAYWASADGLQLVKSVDYYRAHPELHRWATPRRRSGLRLFLVPLAACAGAVAGAAFAAAVLLPAGLFFGWHFPFASIPADAASYFAALVSVAATTLGFQVTTESIATWLVFAISLPCLAWGMGQLTFFARDIAAHLLRWIGGRPSPDQDRAVLTDLEAIARHSKIRTPLLRVKSDDQPNAFAVISPLPGLPRIIVVTRGAMKTLSTQGLRAILAHEVGHIAAGHTARYTWLRLASRILLLGPSAFTGLIQPPDELEGQADAFGVRWLEANGGSGSDLVAVLQELEDRRIRHLFSQFRAAGVAARDTAGDDWLPSRLRQAVTLAHEGGIWRRLVAGWRVQLYLALQSDLATYVYVPFAQRIGMILGSTVDKGGVDHGALGVTGGRAGTIPGPSD